MRCECCSWGAARRPSCGSQPGHDDTLSRLSIMQLAADGRALIGHGGAGIARVEAATADGRTSCPSGSCSPARLVRTALPLRSTARAGGPAAPWSAASSFSGATTFTQAIVQDCPQFEQQLVEIIT